MKAEQLGKIHSWHFVKFYQNEEGIYNLIQPVHIQELILQRLLDKCAKTYGQKVISIFCNNPNLETA